MNKKAVVVRLLALYTIVNQIISRWVILKSFCINMSTSYGAEIGVGKCLYRD